jgi:REP element-mobilizing transposase RayT
VAAMTRARRNQIDLASTSYYHVISRCIRRAYLCGDDKPTGKNFDHRRIWLKDRIKKLSAIFSIEICAYAILSNHYHIVLHVDKGAADTWTHDEVIERWYQLYNGNVLVDRYRNGEVLDEACLFRVKQFVETWRKRLYDISWFMKNLNEFIARTANFEDNCTGKFWEGRFKSQALLDETALLSCMIYVDLNPIRAKMADSLSESDFTSIAERIKQLNAFQKEQQKVKKSAEVSIPKQPTQLLPFGSNDDPKTLPFTLFDYLELADWSGRLINPKKRGSISEKEPKILAVMNIEQDSWFNTVQNFRRQYGSFAGSKSSLLKCAEEHHDKWYKGVG